MRKILAHLRKAVTDYNMISDGDHIAVGVSGGKDSLLLLTALAAYQKFSPQKFDLTAITVDMGFEGTDKEELNALVSYIEGLGVRFVLEKTEIAHILFDIRKEKSPCSLCSKLRRGALNAKAKEIGANKLALGHHSDDALQTLMLSFVYEGRLSCFQPVSHMERMNITLIRPFIYVTEGLIKSVSGRLNLPILHNVCPANKHTQREYMANLIFGIDADIPGGKERMMQAVLHPERNNLWQKPSTGALPGYESPDSAEDED